ncbi:MAG: potassium channel family protein, partial [Acidobacteriota bacterium]
NEEAFFVDPARNIQGLFGSPDLLYFSFITLTTLGYGDITPVAGYARALAALGSLTGLFFLAILIARLVSLYRPVGVKDDESPMP